MRHFPPRSRPTRSSILIEISVTASRSASIRAAHFVELATELVLEERDERRREGELRVRDERRPTIDLDGEAVGRTPTHLSAASIERIRDRGLALRGLEGTTAFLALRKDAAGGAECRHELLFIPLEGEILLAVA